MGTQDQVTQLLIDWRAGDGAALDELTPMIFNELRRLADRHMRSESPAHTLQPTAVVHEAFIRLIDMDVAWQDRAHFFAIAARQMRRILVDHARSRRRLKRGGGAQKSTLDEERIAGIEVGADVLDLDEALSGLAEMDERKSQVIELHYFGGLTYEEIAETLEISSVTVHRDLSMAKAWLQHELKADDGDS